MANLGENLQSLESTSLEMFPSRCPDATGEQLRAGCHAFLDAITAGPAARILLIDAPAVGEDLLEAMTV